MSTLGPLCAIVGATGTGKTGLAVRIAEAVGGEIVSCDSAQIYVGLDVGTASPTAEELARAPHHLIDVLEPDAQWTAAGFAEAADAAIQDIRSRGRVPILVGGNGLWFRALCRGIFAAPPIRPEIRDEVREELARHGAEAMHDALARVDPVAAGRIARQDPQRIGRALEVFRQTGTPISTLQDAHRFQEERYAVTALALDWEREALRAHLGRRVEGMYAGGLLEETRAALDRGLAPDAPGLRTIGYRDAVAHLVGEVSLPAAIEHTVTATRRYAKRQRNWFRHEPAVQWVPPDLDVHRALDVLRPALEGVYSPARDA